MFVCEEIFLGIGKVYEIVSYDFRRFLHKIEAFVLMYSLRNSGLMEENIIQGCMYNRIWAGTEDIGVFPVFSLSYGFLF